MLTRLSRTGWTLAAMAVTLLVAAAPLLGQDGDAPKAKTTSAFQMFFWSDNVLGLIITWVLIIMSICVMALVIQHILANRAETIIPPESVAAMQEMLDEKRFREAIEFSATETSPFGQIVHAALAEAANGYAAMERAVEESVDLVGSKRIRSVEILSVLGAVGPMIGLFGTVYGMIVAFQTIVEVGGQPNPADLAAGISTALVTTFWGLVVGIPAVAAAALIRNRIDALMVEAMIQAEGLIDQFAPKKKTDKAKKPAGDKRAAPTPAG